MHMHRRRRPFQPAWVVKQCPHTYADTVLTGFKRDLAPGLRVEGGATAMLNRVAFRNIEVLKRNKDPVIDASAIVAYPSAALSLVVRLPQPPTDWQAPHAIIIVSMHGLAIT